MLNWKQSLENGSKQVDGWKVRLSPVEVQRMIETADFVNDILHSERYLLENNKEITITVIEKYFARVSNRATLTLICDNMSGETKIKAIAGGTSESWFWKFDWGASKSFISYVKEVLKDYKI